MAGGTLQTPQIGHFVEQCKLQLNDLFWTLQGEGRWTGYRALFVRLPYCNYDCPWCDTEFNSFEEWTEKDFLNFCEKESSRFAVITGGEPLAHKQLPKIVTLLKSRGFKIACETNGSFPKIPGIDFVTCSPKAYTKRNHPEYFVHPDLANHVDEWKYIVDESFNFDILNRHVPDSEEVTFSLSPEFNQMSAQTQRIIEYIKLNPHWKLSLQTHKWINIP